MAIERTEMELKRLIFEATSLGFFDDVIHWEGELKKLREGATT
jgi:hypothetical protein